MLNAKLTRSRSTKAKSLNKSNQDLKCVFSLFDSQQNKTLITKIQEKEFSPEESAKIMEYLNKHSTKGKKQLNIKKKF